MQQYTISHGMSPSNLNSLTTHPSFGLQTLRQLGL